MGTLFHLSEPLCFHLESERLKAVDLEDPFLLLALLTLHDSVKKATIAYKLYCLYAA